MTYRLIMGEEQTKQQQQPHNILALGDSLTAGFHKGGRAFYPYATPLNHLFESAKIPVKIDQKGRSGERVLPAMHNRLQTLLAKDTSYGWIIILAGTNDIVDNVPAAKIFQEGLQPMYDMCLNHREGKTKLAILTVIQIWFYKPGSAREKNRQLLNDMIRDYVTNSDQQDRICLVDLDNHIPYHSITDNNERKIIWDDGVHLTPAGYDRMASSVFDVMKTKL